MHTYFVNTFTGVSAAAVALRLSAPAAPTVLRSGSAWRYVCGCSAPVRSSCVRRIHLCLGAAATVCGTSWPVIFMRCQSANSAVWMAASATCAVAQLPSHSRSHCVGHAAAHASVRECVTPPWGSVQWPKCDFFSGNESHTILGIMAGEWTRKFGPANFDLILEVRPRRRWSVDELASLVSSAYQSF